MFYWGLTSLFVIDGTYMPPYPQLSITELELVPAGVDSPASSIQTGGRGRKTASMTILFENIQAYQTMYSDYLASTVLDLGLPDVPAFSALIKTLGVPTFYKDGKVRADIQFIEV